MKITKRYLNLVQYAWAKMLEACKKAKLINEFKVVDRFLADCLEEMEIVEDTEQNKNQMNLF